MSRQCDDHTIRRGGKRGWRGMVACRIWYVGEGIGWTLITVTQGRYIADKKGRYTGKGIGWSFGWRSDCSRSPRSHRQPNRPTAKVPAAQPLFSSAHASLITHACSPLTRLPGTISHARPCNGNVTTGAPSRDCLEIDCFDRTSRSGARGARRRCHCRCRRRGLLDIV